MRLVSVLKAMFLAGAVLGAQTPRTLPWEGLAPVPWQQVPFQEEPAPPAGAPSGSGLYVDLSPDGTLRILDARGVVLLRAGLPGRPASAWRDGGRPLLPPVGRWHFPDRTLLRGGISALPWSSVDFRPALEGLLWIVDEGEQVITLVHPATRQVAFLPLPGTSEVRLVFWPDRLEVREQLPFPGERREGRCWSVPWLGLLSPLGQLARPGGLIHGGTALNPYPPD